MDYKSRNIYRLARSVAGLTQERWAEALGISTDSVINYEAFRAIPSDDVVSAMCEISGLSALGHWHLRNKSGLAADLLPEVERVPLAQAVCCLVSRMEYFVKDCPAQLLRMAADGKIDQLEQKDYREIMEKLESVVQAALSVKYSEGGNT